MRTELISVIVPVYNVEPWITRCLDSIAAQTYSNIEIIAVDDGSTDRSGRICDEYAALEERLKVVHLPKNRGPSAARNQGILISEGIYIAFIDSDDYVEPDFLEKLYHDLEEHGTDISTCKAYGIKIEDRPAGVYSGGEAIGCLALGRPFNHVPWGKLYPAQLVKKYPFDETIFYSEDLLFLYRIIKHVKKVSYLPEPLYHYAFRDGSQVQSGVDGRKCTALRAQSIVCQDAEIHFPEALPGFQQLALDTDRCLAVLAVKNGTRGGTLSKYLKRLQKDIRRHFSWKALALFQKKKDSAAVLALYASTVLFHGMVVVLRKYKKQQKEWMGWIRKNR